MIRQPLRTRAELTRDDAGFPTDAALSCRFFPMNPRRRTGLSLLEVLLALAILGGTLAIIGELIRVGGRNAEQARDVTTAQIHCESLMAQVSSGLLPAQTTVDVPINDPNSPDEWLYSIVTQPVDQNGLLAVQVTVTQNPQLYVRPVSFAALRWMIDPNSTETENSTDPSSTSTTSSTP